VGEPTPFAPHFEELNEPCPDCGCKPITGQFSYLGKHQDPEAFRQRLMESGVVDVRVFGDVLCALVDWKCSHKKCEDARCHDEPAVTRLAKRARP